MNLAGAGFEVERGAEMQTRDGVVLRSDVYRPADGTGPWPTLLMRIPYNRDLVHDGTYAHPGWYARQGFVVVIQDTRGRHGSDGEFTPFAHERDDGYDTVEWAATLPGSNGRVGMYGASYPGCVQFLAATAAPPHLGAIAPAVTTSDFHRCWTYEDGAFHLAFVAYWAAYLMLDVARRRGELDMLAKLRAITAAPGAWFGAAAPAELPDLAEWCDFYCEWVGRPYRDAYWEALSAWEGLDRITVPILHIAGWYDIFLGGGLETRARLLDVGRVGEQALLVGPWAHFPWGRQVGACDFGAAALSPIVDETQVRFFRRHLGEADVPAEPPVRYFVLRAGEWRDADAWPPPDTKPQAWYLRSAGRANTAGGDGLLDTTPPEVAEPPDLYGFQPGFLVPAAGGHSCCFPGTHPMGAAPQCEVEQRVEVLCYTSAPFAEPVVIAGPVELRAFLLTDAASTDVVARLCVVDATGASVNVADGVRRLGPEVIDAAGAGPVEVRVDLRATAVRVDAGERLRVQITWGAFPTYSVNPHDGTSPEQADPASGRGAVHAVLHEPNHMSRLLVHIREGA